MGELASEKDTVAWMVECYVTKIRLFGVSNLGNTEKETISYQAEPTIALDRIVATHMISKQ